MTRAGAPFASVRISTSIRLPSLPRTPHSPMSRLLLRDEMKDALARLPELEAKCRTLPEFDQALAMMRDLAENLVGFASAPLWRPIIAWRYYRASKLAAQRLHAEMERLGFHDQGSMSP